MNTPARRQRADRAPRQTLVAVAAAFLSTLLSLPSHAALVIPAVPLQSGTPVAPNILFILDDSGSMAPNGGIYMPVQGFTITGSGTVAQPDGTDNTYGEDNDGEDSTGDDGDALRDINDFAYTSNTLYYNPTLTYKTWRQADGSFMAATPYSAAFSDVNLASGTTTNLAAKERAFHAPKSATVDDSLAVNYYRYRFKTDGTADRCDWTQNTRQTPQWNWRNCSAVTTFPSGRDIAQEKANFANWFSFHRTRMKAAKAGASYAFGDLGENYRVGYRSIWNQNNFDIPVGTAGGLFKDVTSGTTSYNRTTWFNRLFAATGNNNTPLQGALQDAGEYFSQTGASGPWGPGTGTQQLACRQNFTILTTDGYWNDQNSFTSVGNVDNTDGPSISGPNNPTYTYDNVAPYSDGYSNTLGDIAMKFWKNDLRTDLANILRTSTGNPGNPAFWQHMVTFGISIGLKGNIDPATVGASTTWGDPGGTSDIPAKIDDLLHAAVNSRGKFVAATNPDAFTQGLRAALSAIDEASSSASNITFNAAALTDGSKSFVANYVSGVWTGDVKAYAVTSTGVSTTALWSAAAPTSIPATRTILTHSGTNNALPVAFPTSTQEATLTTAIANYVKGNRTGEGTIYRTRNSLFGDIVNSSPVYVKEGTTETVYVGANDGMLHAIDATNGRELFTYVPALIDMNQLKELSRPIDFVHKYYVDGPIVVSDRTTQTPNKNILVGTLGRGGKGVFGLDVTTPGTFSTTGKSWEYAGDNDMGMVLGKPQLARVNVGTSGTMAAIVGNGINSQNGKAALFVVNLETGALIRKIPTNNETDNGLSVPTGVDSDGNGTVDLVYAGDLQGNVWKFDLSGDKATWAASKLFTATDPADAAKRQPISGGVTLAFNPTTFNLWVFFGTGRYILETDPVDKSVQSWYGVEDNGTAVSGRSALKARKIELAGTIDGQPVRAFEQSTPGDMVTTPPVRGWVVDLKKPPAPGTAEGERMVGDQSVVGGNVVVASSIIPGSTGCATTGTGYLNFIDAFTGAAVGAPFVDANGDGKFDEKDNLPPASGTGPGTPIGSIDLGVGMPSDPGTLYGGGGGSGSGSGLICVIGSSGNLECTNTPFGPGFGRISWREILRD